MKRKVIVMIIIIAVISSGYGYLTIQKQPEPPQPPPENFFSLIVYYSGWPYEWVIGVDKAIGKKYLKDIYVSVKSQASYLVTLDFRNCTDLNGQVIANLSTKYAPGHIFTDAYDSAYSEIIYEDHRGNYDTKGPYVSISSFFCIRQNIDDGKNVFNATFSILDKNKYPLGSVVLVPH